MNNYLSNLVGKALNQVPLARPRRAPLFAPTPYASGSLGGQQTRPFPSRFALDEADASLEAPHKEFTDQNSRHARAVSTPGDDSDHAHPHPRAEAFDGMRDGHADESHEVIFAASSPASFAPPPPQTHLPPAPQTIISTMSRAAHDETNPDPTHTASFTRAGSGRAQRRGLLETTRPMNADAPDDAATRDTEAALARLRERLSRDAGEAQRLEGEFAAARAGVLNLKADAALHRKSPARALPFAGEDDTREQEQQRRVREHLRAEEVAAARRARSPAPPGRSRALQLKPAPSAAAHTPRRGNSEDVTSSAPAPTIQVTIGRIEVRATNAPASASTHRQSAAAPRLSLEEYLRQRNGGAR